ncbi:hypothetical protein BJ165DRAFT_1406291 [Panaeolus papilionaceus]|nr:hypothetical protein BJ165DRAFT_1406291 [Panaeolus papilionaceus]
MNPHLLNITDIFAPGTVSPTEVLPPDVASQLAIVTYITVGSVAVLIWDIWDNICTDYRLITEFTIHLPTIVYFASRLATVFYALTYTIFNTAAITWDCSRFAKVVTVGYPIAIDATSFLFLLRVRAIFNRDRFFVIFFNCLWIGVVASSLTGPFGTSGINIGTTEYCVIDRFEGYIDAAAIAPLVFDTLVFIAISRRLMIDALVVDRDLRTCADVKALVLGDYLPTLSKALLQDGQVYYLTTITTGLTSVIILFVPGIPSYILRTMLTVPNITLMNIMACRVFRKTKFGLFRETSISTTMIFGSLEGWNAETNDVQTDTTGIETVTSSSPVGSSNKPEEV